MIKPTGQVKITAGKASSLNALVKFLEANKNWLHGNIEKIREQKNKYPAKMYKTDEIYLFLGRYLPLELVVSENKRAKVNITSEKILGYGRQQDLSSINEVQKAIKNFWQLVETYSPEFKSHKI